MIGKLNATVRSSDFSGCLHTNCHSNEESHIKTQAQASNPAKTLKKNGTTLIPSDLSAYDDLVVKRRRNPHNSRESKETQTR